MSIVVLSGLEGTDMGLYDNRDPDEKPVTAAKVVDISSSCPKVKAQAVLKYACVTRGPLVQLNDWYEKGEDLGMWTHFHYEEMGMDSLSADPIFQRFADRWGIRPLRLAQIVFEHAPRN